MLGSFSLKLSRVIFFVARPDMVKVERKDEYGDDPKPQYPLSVVMFSNTANHNSRLSSETRCLISPRFPPALNAKDSSKDSLEE